MDLCNINEIKALLARHGFHFSKAKGQNFLTQNWVPREIVARAGIDETCAALEVGPGIGPLTQELCRSAKKVIAIEVDRSLQPGNGSATKSATGRDFQKGSSICSVTSTNPSGIFSAPLLVSVAGASRSQPFCLPYSGNIRGLEK